MRLAGVPGDDGMLRNDAGERLELVIIQVSPAFDRIVNPYVENLRQIGIDARLERIDNAQYVERRRSGDWDLTNHSPGQGFEPSTALQAMVLFRRPQRTVRATSWPCGTLPSTG